MVSLSLEEERVILTAARREGLMLATFLRRCGLEAARRLNELAK